MSVILALNTVDGALSTTNCDAGLPSATVEFSNASSSPTSVMLVLRTVSVSLSSSMDVALPPPATNSDAGLTSATVDG